jgi:hypothetical protein
MKLTEADIKGLYMLYIMKQAGSNLTMPWTVNNIVEGLGYIQKSYYAVNIEGYAYYIITRATKESH